MSRITRRTALRSALLAAAALRFAPLIAAESQQAPLEEFSYDQVGVSAAIPTAQRQNAIDILLGLSDDSLLQPFRAMAGRPAPGVNLGGWYEYKPDYDHHHDDAGLCPGHALGQWISAMARLSVQDEARGPELAAKARRLTAQLRTEVTPQYFATTRFPAYSLEKLACAMVDMHRVLHDPQAYDTLNALIEAAAPSLPGHAVDREVQWKVGKDISYMWDESFTLPENLLKASDDQPGNAAFRRTGLAYLNDQTFFEPLSRSVNVMADRHAYSYVNSLNSAMQAWFSTGSTMHRLATLNGFAMLQEQSFATGGWGPEELLRKQGYDELIKTLAASHNGFEAPCSSFAHCKLTRYLLRATRDGRYGDSMERVLLNTTAGILPLQPDGRTFYYADYNQVAKRIYSVHRWPCCSGTYAQVVADYGINTYLREPGAVWVNLYHPSELRLNESGNAVVLTQTGTYPTDGNIRLHLNAAKPCALTLQLRIPQWASNAEIKVNGKPQAVTPTDGFAALRRVWRNNDTVELLLPMPLRLEALPANGGPAHPDVVALLYGPLVLFPIRQPGESGPLAISRDALLGAKRTGPAQWTVQDTAGTRLFVPFSQLGDRLYTLYCQAPITHNKSS
ncbi:beta-L-arabinofuranosidase domain-containing protein [Terriglobus sp.]|uniref:beta-L-arabinofuranosidase domain-containing protein n=1 Tax=Terriglobus sp. TaxID=1889013 RepID=UPI003AFFDC7E